jgi:phosphohistidine phosphatase
MYEIVPALQKIGVQPDLIVSSPYLRAKQTAEILVKVLKYKHELVFTELLLPLANVNDLIGEINEKYSVGELVLVGHEPGLSILLGTLIARNPDLAINMKKGGVCCLSADDLHTERKAVLEWLLTPKILSELT